MALSGEGRGLRRGSRPKANIGTQSPVLSRLAFQLLHRAGLLQSCPACAAPRLQGPCTLLLLLDRVREYLP